MNIVPMSGTRVAVLLAVSTLEHPDVPAVAAACGLSRGTTFYHLRLLRAAGWVTWTDGRKGTLRSRYTAHPPIKETA